MPELLKINWYPVQVPASELRLQARELKNGEKPQYGRHVRQYEIGGARYAVVVAPGDTPPECEEMSVGWQAYPWIAQTLVYEAFLSHFATLGFEVIKRKGEGELYRQREVEGLPATLLFYDGLSVKPFYIPVGTTILFGLVLDYASRQEFVSSLADDPRQRALMGRYEVAGERSDGSQISGFAQDAGSGRAVLMSRSGPCEIPLTELKVRASYSAIRAYFSGQAGRDGGTDVVRRLQIASLSLNSSGYANTHQLAQRYAKVKELLGGARAANINVRVRSLCRSVVSIASEPADIEVR